VPVFGSSRTLGTPAGTACRAPTLSDARPAPNEKKALVARGITI
jgi:hypothetical protein